MTLTVHQCLADTAGYPAYTDLKAGALRNEFSNTLAELSLVILNRSLSQRQ